MRTSPASSIACSPPAFWSARRVLRWLELTLYLALHDVLSRLVPQAPWRIAAFRRRREAVAPAAAIASLVEALDAAAALYVKPVRCLQRAFVATSYLRLRGYGCVLVVGAHVVRKEGHAWVEAGTHVVGDPRNLRRFFQALTRV
jgi:Transglutaminase-like superfamily